MTLQGPSGGSLHPGVHGAGPHSGPQDPGPHGHDPGPSFHPQQHVPARPVFYIHPPPPPPFLHYQWPMPFPPYNPFGGFPGMGYGMVMPSFPPPPYMDASAYLLPQPHIQPVDYRRLIHPQAHPPGAPFHNRVRPPHVAPPRETVNSEVQTEPPHREAGGYGGGSLLASSDSGHGTASSSPSSSSSPLKRHSEGQTLPRTDADDFQVDEAGKSSTLKHGGGSGVPLPVKPVHSHVGATLETERSRAGPTAPERVPSSSCSGAHCHTWSVSSLDGSAPICCSSQEENEDPRERRVSIPDILMSWAGGTPQSKVIKMTKVHPHCNHQGSSQTEPERDGPLYRSPAVTPGMTDSSPAEGALRSKVSETFYKILKPKMSDELEESDETSPEEDAAEVLHNRVPLNSSVWSVDSLPPYTPSGEWLLQNGLLGPQVIVEMREELEGYAGSTGGDDPTVGAGRVKQHRWLPSADSAPLADGCLASSTPAQPPPRGPALDCETPQMKGPTCGLTPEDVPLVSTTGLRCPLAVGEQSPDQEALLVTERNQTSVCPRALEDVLFSSPAFRKEPDQPTAGSRAASETEGGDAARLRTEQLSVPPAPQPETKVSPSKGHLVDCGVQCPDLQEPVDCEAPTGTRRQPLKYSGGKMAAAEGQSGGSGKNGHVQRNPKRTNYGRSRGSGGTGRNPRSKY